MKRSRRWVPRWSSFLTGVCIGLLIVTPVLASGNDAAAVSALDGLRESAAFLLASSALAARMIYTYVRQSSSRRHGQR